MSGHAMGEVTSGRSHSINALAEKAEQCMADIDGAKYALSQLRPKNDDIKNATLKGASL